MLDDGADDPTRVRERTGARGSMRMERASDRRLSMCLRGSLLDEDGAFVADWLDEMLPTCTRAIVDIELDELEAYTPGVRKLAQNALLRHADRWTRVLTLVRSRIVVMGVAVANVALGGRIEAFTKREDFDRAIASAIVRSQ